MIEIWKNIKGFENKYQISNLGNVRTLHYKNSKSRVELMTPQHHTGGYLFIGLRNKTNKKVLKYIHRLVAEAFIPNPDNLPCVNHKDENKTNNCVDNLEWCTQEYNINYGTHIERQRKTQFNGKCSKPVIQFDLDGNVVKEWISMSEVQRQLGINVGSIINCCKNKIKQSGGYVWKYKEVS